MRYTDFCHKFDRVSLGTYDLKACSIGLFIVLFLFNALVSGLCPLEAHYFILSCYKCIMCLIDNNNNNNNNKTLFILDYK